MGNFFLIFLCFTASLFLLIEYSECNSVELYLKSSFKHYFQQLANIKSKQKTELSSSEFLSKTSLDQCSLCSIGASLVIALRQKLGFTRSVFSNGAKLICRYAEVNGDVCDGIIDLHVDIFLYIMDNTPSLSGKRFCGVYMQYAGCEQPDGYDWSVDIPSGESILRERNLTSSEPLKIVHISDIHYEPEYIVGSKANCDQPVCCIRDSGYPENNNDVAAGIWGMNKGYCDTPWVTVLNTFESISTNHADVDYIYYTGDTVPHEVWKTSTDYNAEVLDKLMHQINSSFPNIPVIPVIGNHEPSPVNAFAPLNVTQSNVSTIWLYELFANELQDWFPSDALETIKKGGFYTLKLRDGLRVVVLNTNFCLTENWWLLYQDSYIDPANQLQWLVGVLEEAEQNGEFVHILAHIPTSAHYCLNVWSREYRKIVERFHYTISGQFFGDTHLDDYTVYVDFNTSEPIGVTYNGGSVQPGTNPNYIVYEVDSGNYTVLNKESWIFNLNEANENPDENPSWYKLYNFKEAFGIADLTPKSMYDLVLRMATESSLRQQYYRYRYRTDNISCNDSCYKELLCRMIQSEANSEKLCDAVYSIYK